MPSLWHKIGVRAHGSDDEAGSNSAYSPSSNDERAANSSNFPPEAYYRDQDMESTGYATSYDKTRLGPPSIHYPNTNDGSELGNNDEGTPGYAATHSSTGTAKRSLKQKLGLGFASRSRDDIDEAEEEGHSRFGLGRRVSQRRKDTSPYRKSHEWTPGQRTGTTNDRPEEQGGTLPFTHTIPRKMGNSVSEGSALLPNQFLQPANPTNQMQTPSNQSANAASSYASAHPSIPPPPNWPAAYTGHAAAHAYQPYRNQQYVQTQHAGADVPASQQGQNATSESMYSQGNATRQGGGWRQQQQPQQRPASPLDFGKLARSSDVNDAQSTQQSRRSSDTRTPVPQTPVSAIAPGRPRINTQASNRDSEYRGQSAAQSATDMSKDEVNTLIRDHRELREKYSRVKRYYFDKDDQVKQLQNAMASQRMSQSRTSLDDNEYVNRLTRLDGLIAQLAFGMRKEWKSIPTWLQAYVNSNAIATGKQEMTAVGRAFVSRWLADRVFDLYFHPGLAPELSTTLKLIQRRIRLTAPKCRTSEEEDALTAKITDWRLTTVDGLQAMLTGPEAASQRLALAGSLEEELLDHLHEHLQDPPPAGLEGGVRMVVELAIGILANLPLESREVHIEYFQPGHALDAELMRLESGIAPLVQAVSQSVHPAGTETDGASFTTAVSDMQDVDAEPQEEREAAQDETSHEAGAEGGADGAAGPGGALAIPTTSVTDATPTEAKENAFELPGGRVRMCAFLACQIRGKMVLAKAPVWKM